MTEAVESTRPASSKAALWLPLLVKDLVAAGDFYRKLGLPVVDSFDGGEIFAVGESGRIEIATSQPCEPPVAIEVSTWDDVNRLAALAGGEPKVFERGHYGFLVKDPDGHQVLVWSERR